MELVASAALLALGNTLRVSSVSPSTSVHQQRCRQHQRCMACAGRGRQVIRPFTVGKRCMARGFLSSKQRLQRVRFT